MSPTNTQVRKPAETVPNKPLRPEASAFKQAMEVIEKSVPSAQAVVITTLPRGSLQIAQPAKLPEALYRAYAREFHLEDRLTWQAILRHQAVAARDVLGADHRFMTEFLQQNGLAFAAAAPLKAPVIEGYAGALHLYRTAEQGAFNPEELRQLCELAAEVDALIEQARESRRTGNDDPAIMLTPRPAASLFAFDANGQQLLSPEEFARFDQRLRDAMAEQAQVRLNKLNGELVVADRVQIADSRGDLWTFRVVTYARNPGIAPTPIVLFCLQPSCAQWAAVRPSDLAADVEMSRLIPALRFMRQEFHRGPTLGEIAKQVHLSPFHFHRRFAELLGLTPKHYLLECQITAAKAELLARKKELSQVAADCGFAHQSHFTSRFKQATGLTPTRWRRLAGERRD